ncbi:unnamed protein product [Clonostachys rhizophaga]|uniref:Uncharacterized protein n=1 Tax=Clonostachys rhizophaga TaxID=160324 RepID=A0A9N9VGE4_9HYPO|nr:unnamed protein product [Clonostachys rhizophaga]
MCFKDKANTEQPVEAMPPVRMPTGRRTAAATARLKEAQAQASQSNELNRKKNSWEKASQTHAYGGPISGSNSGNVDSGGLYGGVNGGVYSGVYGGPNGGVNGGVYGGVYGTSHGGGYMGNGGHSYHGEGNHAWD